MMTWPGPGRGRCGRSWGRSRPRWPAPQPGRVTGGRCPGCWMSPCPGHPGRPDRHPRAAGPHRPHHRHPGPPPRRRRRADPAVQWRVIVTNPAGQAIAVTRIRRRTRASPAGGQSCRDGPGRDSPPGTGLAGRVTLTITQHTITAAQQTGWPGPPGPPARAGPLGRGRSAGRDQPAGPRRRHATARSPPPRCGPPPRPWTGPLAHAQADQAAGGCAHTGQSPAYRPPPRLREFVIARDVTCRNPACRQPAWRADLDHTHPYDQDGRTCDCNLGGACRSDHQLKQHPRWKLEQTTPGHFTWTTPAGRTYTTGPDIHPV